MDPQLLDAMQRYEMAAEPSLTYIGIAWDDFEELLSHSRRLENLSKGLLLVGQADDFLKTLRRAIRVLRLAPLDPADEFVELKRVIDSTASTRVDGDLAAAIVSTQSAAMTLFVETHQIGRAHV